MARHASIPDLRTRLSSSLRARTATERWWRLGGAAAALLVVLVAWTFLIGPQRSQTADVVAQGDAARDHNAQLSRRIDALRADNRTLSAYQAAFRSAQLALPADTGIPDLLRSLQTMGTATHTDVSLLNAAPPAPVVAAAPATGTPSPSSSPSGSAASTTSTAGTAGTPAADVYSMAVSVDVTGSAAALEAFLTRLQTGQPRAVLITQVTEGGPGAVGAAGAPVPSGATSLQLTMQVFVAPQGVAH